MTVATPPRRIVASDFATFLETWRGVPYRDCGDTRQGVDCLRFAIIVLDWLHGFDAKTLPPVPLLPKQTAINNPKKAQDVVKFVRDRYKNVRVPVSYYESRPGDVIVCRNQIHEGHVLVAGPQRNVIWHSVNLGTSPKGGCVYPVAVQWCYTVGILCVFRPTGIEVV